jgi:hypothetical protein
MRSPMMEKAEVARLDGAGVDRAHRNFVDAVAFHADEGIGVGVVAGGPAGVEILAQRERVRRPGAVAQPLALVHRALGADAEQVEGGALHAVGLGEDAREVRIGGPLRVQIAGRPDQANAAQEGDVQGEAPAQMPVVRAPQGEQLTALLADGAGEGRQALRLQGEAPDGAAAFLGGQGEFDVAQVCFHLSLPAVAPPACTSRRDKAG